jgi:NAD-dependent dihydropyrimidine dehydrogenase PreA subunit
MNFRVKVKKCDPGACGYRCLKVCPTGVFLCAPQGGFVLLRDQLPRGFKIIPRFASLCIGCRKCVEVCPENAIEIREK